MPALAVCQALVRKGIPEGSIEFLGSKNGQDRKLLQDTKYKLHELNNRPLNRKLNKDLFLAIILMFRSLIGGFKKVKEINPNVVVAVGGFASVPGIIGAKLNGIPIVQINLDKAPGLAVRFGSRFAQVVADGFTETGLSRSVFVGIPIRSDIADTVGKRAKLTKEMSREIYLKLGLTDLEAYKAQESGVALSESTKTVVLMGGSLGAKALNDLGLELAAKLNLKSGDHGNETAKIVVYHIAGNRGINEIIFENDTPDNYLLKGFEPRMDLLYQVADLIICRAGASTMAEILAVGIPSILIPLPNAPRNHQYFNAKTVEKLGACIVIEQKDLTVDSLSTVVLDLLKDANRLESMSNNAKKAAAVDAGDKIADIIISKVRRN
jgi:UDP-N-acetylglucosamine--N-acetylmuramyl-(pentapeptide) pyrophosphoryl-undecaprenol N-acetylglucosamine transferase